MTHCDEDGPVECAYCDRTIRLALAEACWHCGRPLCFCCWEDIGHCGSPEAYRLNRELVQRMMKV